MSEHLTEQQIKGYRERTISAADLIALDSHASSCHQCRNLLSMTSEEELFELSEELNSESTPEHLDYDKIVAYVDGSLDDVDMEIAESHLAICTRCELLLSDLSVFKDEIKADVGREYAPPLDATTHQPSPALLASLSSFFSFNSPAWAAALGVVVLLAAGFALWLALRSDQTGSTQPVVQSGTPPPVSTPQNAGNPTPTPEALPEATPQVLLALNDGSKQIALDEKGNLTGLDELPPAYRQLIKTALSTQQAADASALAGVGVKQGSLRGGTNKVDGFAPLNPVGIVILTNRPVLRWTKLDDAIRYSVTIYDENFNAVASSPQLSTTSWAVAGTLNRGQVYSWQVTAMDKDGREVKSPVPPASEAKFKVLEGARAVELSRARQSFSGSHLTMGVLYARAGLLDEAEREFLMLLKQNPQSGAAQKLLQSVRALKRGR